MHSPSIEKLISLLAKLPGLGPRSGRRSALHLLKRRGSLLQPLIQALQDVDAQILTCNTCFNIDTHDPCTLCRDDRRDQSLICVVEDVADLWALERAASFKGVYHVLGGVLSALDGIGPGDLSIDPLLRRVKESNAQEIILATNATLAGQTTAHYITDRLQDSGVKITRLAYGLPIGGELDYLDEGTLTTAMNSRRAM